MKVYIVGFCSLVKAMFIEEGWEIAEKIDEEDVKLLQFLGGADVNPVLYDSLSHPSTRISMAADNRDLSAYAFGLDNNIPMAGICRGGQFLNVMNEGTMVQHCDHHSVSHEVFDKKQSKSIMCTSTHHQMMMPNHTADIVGYVPKSRTTVKEIVRVVKGVPLVCKDSRFSCDPEVVVYKGAKCLCFQPHPEYAGYEECTRWYFRALEEIL